MKELRIKAVEDTRMGPDGKPQTALIAKGGVSFFLGDTSLRITPDTPLRIPADISEADAEAAVERYEQLEIGDPKPAEVEPTEPLGTLEAELAQVKAEAEGWKGKAELNENSLRETANEKRLLLETIAQALETNTEADFAALIADLKGKAELNETERKKLGELEAKLAQTPADVAAAISERDAAQAAFDGLKRKLLEKSVVTKLDGVNSKGYDQLIAHLGLNT